MDNVPSLPFALLRPVHAPASAKPHLLSELTPAHIQAILRCPRETGGALALDFETCGDTAMESGARTVGVALSNGEENWYIDFKEHSGAYETLMRILHEERTPLIAHNVFFDAAWPMRDFGLELNFVACTFAWYKLLATEGFLGQEWGLKAAQRDVLGWTETNEVGLDRWLIDNGYSTSVSKEEKQGYYWYPGDVAAGGALTEGRWKAPDKSQMWRAPTDVLGKYACLDAESCWLLYHRVLKPAAARFDALRAYLEDYPAFINLHIRQKHRGMLVNRPKLEEYRNVLRTEIGTAEASLFNSPLVEPHIRLFNAEIVAAHEAKQPGKYIKSSVGENLKEPTKLTKKGTINRAWLTWDEKRKQPPVVSKSWLNWATKLEELKAAQHFNVNSGHHKRWLLFDKLGYQPTGVTETGLPSTDYDAMLSFGEVGRLFNTIADKEKLAQFCEQILALLWSDNTLHPGFLMPGTLTGRLSGKSPNIMQMPKDLRFLACLQARPGYKLITCDVVSLENYVMAELSKDPSLWELYGPNARPGQDAYLFNASQLPVIGPRIRARGYDPFTATPEDTKRAKKESKEERSIGKTITLAANYGAGAKKMHWTMRTQGNEVTLVEAEQMHAGFWQLYRGIKEWERELQRQYRKNQGWILNGIGRPIGVAQDYVKDLVNRVCQSTGHDAFMKWLLIVTRLFEERGVEAHPWVADLHDCGIFEVAEAHVEEAVHVMQTVAYDHLNDWLDGEIPLKGEAKVCANWAEDKSESLDDLARIKEFLA